MLLYGISPILDRYVPGIFYLQLGLEKDLEKGIVMCLLCFILGCALQSVQEFLFEGLSSHVKNRCLAIAEKTSDGTQAKGILSNEYRREGLIKLADKLFSDKGLGEFDPNNKKMCSYFIDYCDYSNSVKGFSSKSSRLSESATFYEQIAVAFYALTVIGILISIFSHTNVLLYCLGYLAMGSIFTGKAYQCRLNWAKTVLSTYEAVNDLVSSMHNK